MFKRKKKDKAVNKTPVVTESSNEEVVKPKKKKKWLKIAIPLALLIVVMAGGGFFWVAKTTPVEEEYESSLRWHYDVLEQAINRSNYDLWERLTLEDSYIVKNLEYDSNYNRIPEMLSKTLSSVSFEYPMVDAVNRFGDPLEEDGSSLRVYSFLGYDDPISIRVPDFQAIEENLEIEGVVFTDSKSNDDRVQATEMFIDYYLGLEDLPMKDVEVVVPLSQDDLDEVDIEGLENSVRMVTSDVWLSELLFSSEEFRSLLDAFGSAVSNTDNEQRFYYESEEVVEEPVLDENGEQALDENGEEVVEERAVWENKLVKTRKLIDDNWIGAYYLLNEHPDAPVRPLSGEGTKESPASVGTPVSTKALTTSGEFVNVEIRLIGYWYGSDAIDYAMSYSEQNRGFDPSSVLKLATFEVEVTNMEDIPVEIESLLMLSDENANITARTGTMYGFESEAKLDPYETVILQDWTTSTVLLNRYLIWGKNFDREHDVVWFDIFGFDSEE